MIVFLRRLRGVAGIGIFWFAAWTCYGGLFGFVPLLITSQQYPPLQSAMVGMVLSGALVSGMYGLVLGLVFGSILAVAERSRGVEELRRGRMAAWGAMGGAAVPLAAALVTRGAEGFVMQTAIVMVLSSVMGALSAVGTLQVARSAKLDA